MAKKPAKARKTAVRKVLTLPELVSAIVTHLPSENLFVVQRVNTIFHDIITKTKAFQETMYHTNLPRHPVPHAGTKASGTILTSPALKKAMAPLLLGHAKTTRKKIILTAEYTPKPYYCRPNAIESWRRIRLDCGDLPVLLRSDGWDDLELPAKVTLGEIYDKFFYKRMMWDSQNPLSRVRWAFGNDLGGRVDVFDEDCEFEEFEDVEDYTYRG